MINKNVNMANEVIALIKSPLPDEEKTQKFREITQKEISSEFFVNILPVLFKEFKDMPLPEVESILDNIIVNSLLCGFEILIKEKENTQKKTQALKDYADSVRESSGFPPEVINKHLESVVNSISAKKLMFPVQNESDDIYSRQRENIFKVYNPYIGKGSGMTPEEYCAAAGLMREAVLKLKDDDSEQKRISDLAIKRLINNSDLPPMYIILMRRLITIADSDLLTNEKMISNAINACILNNIEVVPLEKIPKYEKEVFSQYQEKLSKNYAIEDIQEHLNKMKDLMTLKTITSEEARAIYQKTELDKDGISPEVTVQKSQKLS